METKTDHTEQKQQRSHLSSSSLFLLDKETDIVFFAIVSWLLFFLQYFLCDDRHKLEQRRTMSTIMERSQFVGSVRKNLVTKNSRAFVSP